MFVGALLGGCALFYDVAVHFDCLVYLKAIFEEFVVVEGGFRGWGSEAWAFNEEGALFYLFAASYALPVLAVSAF